MVKTLQAHVPVSAASERKLCIKLMQNKCIRHCISSWFSSASDGINPMIYAISCMLNLKTLIS